MKLTAALQRRLEKTARRTAGVAYAPYSNFPVGVALLTGSGKIFAGCNVENAVYNLGNCAERTALGNAVAAGEREVRCVVLYTPTPTPTSPCGACRQVLHEFGPEARFIAICDSDERLDTTIAALLPSAFHL